jgi:small subunit ribosomal protein S4e
MFNALQARGPKKHLKRMYAPSHWQLDKLIGPNATRPSTGPHKLRECIPLSVLLRQRLKYALSGQECIKICRDKDVQIKVDNRARRDPRFPLGLMDVVNVVRTGENFRILYDVKGRFMPIRIESKEASFKLCKVKSKTLGKNKIPYIVTHDGRTIRFPHPEIKKTDTIKVSRAASSPGAALSLCCALLLIPFQKSIIFNTAFP